ncbi:uncharacterized protein isoform X1 [Danio rerio]|uniref:Uncharacterized protein isoform X1 n=2 Tax=Danio rerio TaxID=7955 RepID=A0AC58HY31_DANRE
MMINHHLKFLLFSLIFKTGFSAEISVFVLTGDSVELDIQTKLPEFEELTWIYNKLESIVKYYSKFNIVNSYPAYNNRAILNETTFSLILENMQKKDSGLYTARINGQIINDIVTYRISVLDAVKAPVLTVNSVMFSSNSCTVNFTCRTQDLVINSNYQNNTCSQEEVTSQENNTLILSCSEELIMCNYSNPVSWKKDETKIKQLCVNKENEETKAKPTLLWLYVLIAAIVMLILVGIGIVIHRHTRKTGTRVVSETVYAQVEGQEMKTTNCDAHTYDVPERLQTPTQEEMEVNNPTTTYCTVGQHKKPTNPIEPMDHTIYSSVCKQPPNKQTVI